MMLAAAALAIVKFVTSGPGSTSLISVTLGVVSPLPLYLVLGWAGYRLWSTDEAPAMEGATGAVAASSVRLSA